MCFHASRFDARQISHNDFVLYEDQDESLWNKELIGQGNYYLDHSAKGEELSSYHLEAGIAFWHCSKEETSEKWENILHQYNLLLQINYSSTVALNRIYALYRANHFYFTLLGELYTHLDNEKARDFLQRACDLAKTTTDKQTLQFRINRLD